MVAALWGGCKEEGKFIYIDDSMPAPAQVTDVTVRNTPGGAVLYYKVPEDQNLLYVQAVYEIQPGVQRECKSSYYKDSLVLEGFGDTRLYDVKLYSIGKNEKASEPLTVQVNPSLGPVHLATTQMRDAFGGVSVSIENPERASLAIILMGDTAKIGYQSYLESFYTSAERASFALRGLDTIQGNYSVYLRDRWNNLSDTTYATLTPMYEELIPKNTWQEVHLPTDSWEPLEGNAAYAIPRIWDGQTTSSMFSSTYDSPMPHWITWDLGINVIISRFKYWQRTANMWERSHLKIFEFYGSMNPNPDGSWDESWIPLGRFENVKPSQGTTVTAEDIAFGSAGVDFDLEMNEFAPNPFVPIRYVRLKCIETFNGPRLIDGMWVCEISFWGQILK